MRLVLQLHGGCMHDKPNITKIFRERRDDASDDNDKTLTPPPTIIQ